MGTGDASFVTTGNRAIRLAAVALLLGALPACSEEFKTKVKETVKEKASQAVDDFKKKQAEKRAKRAADAAANEVARRARQANEPPKGPKVPGTGFVAGTEYLITHVRVEVDKAKAYDNDSPPDPKVDVRVDGTSVGSCRKSDTTVLECKLRWASFVVQAETELSLVVVDKDLLVDDPIGVATLAHLTKHGALDTPLPMHARGGVVRATVVIGKPPAVSRSRARIYGAIAGLGLALLLLLLFSRYLFDESRYLVGRAAARPAASTSPSPASASNPAGVAVKVRCQHCSALNDETDPKCHECGGTL